jgi:taurine--2-oxoglutarate transaminase
MLKKISAELMKKGVYLVNVINTFLVAPPLIVTEKEVNDAIDVFDDALKIADKETE